MIQKEIAIAGLAQRESIHWEFHGVVLDPSSWSALQETWLSPAARRLGAGLVRALLRSVLTLRFDLHRYRGRLANPVTR